MQPGAGGQRLAGDSADTVPNADVIANVAVMVSGLLVLLSGSRFPDILVGAAIGVYVVREALEILSEAREST
jgi:Co/Zn/Cd efflux system component